MTKKNVLICGATGFIGRNIAETLVQREDLKIFGTHFSRPPLAHPGINPVKVDLTRDDEVERCVKKMDIIIQAAATTSGSKDIVNRPYIHVTDNAVMNSLLFRAAVEAGVSHVVFFSCTVMYPSSEAPLTESDYDANAPMHQNYFGVGWTKVYIEKMCEFYSRIGQTKFTAIRHSNIYGPHDKYDLEKSHVFGATVTKVMQNQDGQILVWGPGSEKRDLLYVEDLIDFVEKAIDKQTRPFELINVGLGEAISIQDLVKKIIAHSKKSIAIKNDLSSPHIPTSLFLDTTKAKAEFNWTPNHSLDEGIKKTLSWYKSSQHMR